jgi:hypothetical protein
MSAHTISPLTVFMTVFLLFCHIFAISGVDFAGGAGTSESSVVYQGAQCMVFCMHSNLAECRTVYQSTSAIFCIGRIMKTT